MSLSRVERNASLRSLDRHRYINLLGTSILIPKLHYIMELPKIRNILNVMTYQAYSLGFTQPLTEMSARNTKIIMFLGSKMRRLRRADSLTTICEPIV
jgi:hypothetical protein